MLTIKRPTTNFWSLAASKIANLVINRMTFRFTMIMNKKQTSLQQIIYLFISECLTQNFNREKCMNVNAKCKITANNCNNKNGTFWYFLFVFVLISFCFRFNFGLCSFLSVEIKRNENRFGKNIFGGHYYFFFFFCSLVALSFISFVVVACIEYGMVSTNHCLSNFWKTK